MKLFLIPVLSGALTLGTVHAENLLQNGSFEAPKVIGRTLPKAGGDPARSETPTTWSSLVLEGEQKDGKLTAGITDEIARTGKQSIFVDFQKVTDKKLRATLTSDIFPVKSESPYTVSIWGRLDRVRPLTLDARRPHFILQVEFFGNDLTQVGDTEYRVQMIPGGVIPGLGPRLIFNSSSWNQYSTDLKSPEGAAFMKISYRFEAAVEPGVVDGAIYFDDAAVDGEKGTLTLEEAEKNAEATAAAEEAEEAAAAATPPAALAPAAPAPASTPKK